MARTTTIIAYFAAFLSGVFLTTLISTYKLTSTDFMVANLEMPSFVQEPNGMRGSSHRADADKNANQLHSMESSDKTSGGPLESKEKHKGMCSLLPQPTPTALSMWSAHLPNILNATQHPADEQFIYREFTTNLLHFMTPDRMQRGVKTLPLDWTPVERGLDIMYKRLKFLQDAVNEYKAKNNLGSGDVVPKNVLQKIQEDPKTPRPLNVLVMGGSVTMGVVCHINPVISTGISRRVCAWPGRMTSFFSMLFGGYQLIEFHTVAMGGTNTESGITMWDYSLLPGDIPYPDVVINAYATNDMHYNSVQTALAKNITLERSVIELNQEFVRQVLTPKRECYPPPLLLYLDDYLGNEQSEVLTTMVSSQAIHLMSGYYGLGSISYADAVRDVVYGDNRESWYHSDWFEKGTYERAVHPHMGMHITNTWVVGFYFMNLMTTFCSLPVRSTGEETPQQKMHAHLHAGLEIKGLPTDLKGGPIQRPRGIPPVLTDDLSLEHITRLWTDDSKAKGTLWKSAEECTKEGKGVNDNIPIEKPCMYSWIVGLERFMDKPKTLTEKIKSQMIANEGWSAVNDNNKLGWVPSGNKSKFTLEWKSVIQSVRTLTLMIMRSYGEKWEGSKLKLEIWSKETLVKSDEIVGFHDKKTSETYNIKIKIGEIPVGNDLKINFELIGGTTFKITGMAICGH